MPRVPPDLIKTVVYLYRSVEDAEGGRDFGGTGFLVALESKIRGRFFQYAVSNWHVVCDDGASVIRVTKGNDDMHIWNAGPDQWHFDPRFDIAVIPVHFNLEEAGAKAIHSRMLLTQEKIDTQKLGPGEDVFMVGRFVDHDGGPINRPSLRFGNISVMPSPMEQPNGGMVEAFCIDMHSRSGYSGSPVFVYRTPGSDLEQKFSGVFDDNTEILVAGNNFLALLGIHYAQFPEQWELKEGKSVAKATASGVPLISSGAYVKGLSGMTCVLPAWTILEVLNMPKLKQLRDDAERVVEEQLASEGRAVPEPEGARPEAEIARLRDEGLRRALNTPPSPRTKNE